MNSPFIPTYKWHLKVWAILFILCLGAWGLAVLVSHRLPAPYQRYIPPAETTPWLTK